MTVGDAVGAAIASEGVRDAFGVVGSGNLVVTNALRRAGRRLPPTLATRVARSAWPTATRESPTRSASAPFTRGRALRTRSPGLTEAVKSRTPMLVLAGEAPAAARTSNFRIAPGRPRRGGRRRDRPDPRRCLGGRRRRPRVSPRAVRAPPGRADAADRPAGPAPPSRTQRHRARLRRSTRPFRLPRRSMPSPSSSPAPAGRRSSPVAGRCSPARASRSSGSPIFCGAVLATSAPANGLFSGLPYAVGIAGGFASAPVCRAARRRGPGDCCSAPPATTGPRGTGR